MTEQDKRIFPIVYSFEGHPSDSSSTFLVEGICFDGSTVRFAIPVDNIQHFIAFLLIWVRTLSDAVDKKPRQPGQSGPASNPSDIVCHRATGRKRSLHRNCRRSRGTYLFGPRFVAWVDWPIVDDSRHTGECRSFVTGRHRTAPVSPRMLRWSRLPRNCGLQTVCH
jgi:hypothetical protein